ncbi:MAG: hypothetical protein ACRDRJ_23290 [Streptosporangiaceae bacterium]
MMPGRQADSRSLNFAGDIDEQGRPLPMSVEALRARTGKWPLSPHTPDGVAAQLGRARRMFIDGYYTYENFIDAATRSLQAVEAALRVRLEAGSKISFAQLIDQAKEKGLIDDSSHDILHTGRILRNQQIHATTTDVFNPAIAAGIISTSHGLVAGLFEDRLEAQNDFA